MNGCDVSACHRETYMGWRPLTERLGRKICEYHWHRHEDPEDGFDLFEAFGFRRPVRSPRRLMQTGTRRCDCDRALSHRRQCRDCGQPREPGRCYCEKCGQKRNAQSNRKRQQRHYRRLLRAQKPNAFARPLYGGDRLSGRGE
ncbi:MAG: hypothetical protein ACYTEK_18030 [Planctomycetota bacterium]|jgi:hypothetical protein